MDNESGYTNRDAFFNRLYKNNHYYVTWGWSQREIPFLKGEISYAGFAPKQFNRASHRLPTYGLLAAAYIKGEYKEAKCGYRYRFIGQRWMSTTTTDGHLWALFDDLSKMTKLVDMIVLLLTNIWHPDEFHGIHLQIDRLKNLRVKFSVIR